MEKTLTRSTDELSQQVNFNSGTLESMIPSKVRDLYTSYQEIFDVTEAVYDVYVQKEIKVRTALESVKKGLGTLVKAVFSTVGVDVDNNQKKHYDNLFTLLQKKASDLDLQNDKFTEKYTAFKQQSEMVFGIMKQYLNEQSKQTRNDYTQQQKALDNYTAEVAGFLGTLEQRQEYRGRLDSSLKVLGETKVALVNALETVGTFPLEKQRNENVIQQIQDQYERKTLHYLH